MKSMLKRNILHLISICPCFPGLKPVSEDKEDETAYEGIEEIEEIIAEGVDQVQMLTLILPRGDAMRFV